MVIYFMDLKATGSNNNSIILLMSTFHPNYLKRNNYSLNANNTHNLQP